VTVRLAARVLVLALLPLVVLAACGGGPRLTRREFARDASRICRQASERVTQVTVPPFADGRSAALALARVSRRGRDALRELRDLGAPKADATRIDTWLAVLDQALDEVDFAATALDHGDHGVAREAAARAGALDRRGRELGRAYDVAPCRLTGALPDG